MAILAIVVAQDVKKEAYETLRKEVDWESREPEGLIFHAVAFDASGAIRAADVWTSQEAMDRFFDTRLLPAMRKLNISPPKREIYPLHAAHACSAVDQYKTKLVAH